MVAKIQKWGNSLGVRLPKHLLDELEIEENASVEIVAKGDNILIYPIKKKSYSLKELMSAITKDNLHTEIEDDAPAGKEVW